MAVDHFDWFWNLTRKQVSDRCDYVSSGRASNSPKLTKICCQHGELSERQPIAVSDV